MRYPDGSMVSRGDHIWWNEGSCVGFVHEVVEGGEDDKKWGFDEPHLLLSGYHPSDPGGPGYVAYAETDLEREGISRLTDREEADYRLALDSARRLSGYSEPFQLRYDSFVRPPEWVFEKFEEGKFRKFARVKSESGSGRL